jgi:BlaI family penicillinase repressor
MMTPKISESEWCVMKVLWSKSPSTANEIVEALSARRTWKPKTIKTLLNRLLKKKAIGYEKKGKEFHYYPLVSKAECIGAESRNFVHRVWDGALTPMVATFLESEDLSGEDIKELKGILDKKERG